jgi:hypothetical protein
MAAILRAAKSIKREAGILGVAKRLWSVSRDLDNLRILQLSIYERMLQLPDGGLDETLIKGNVESTASLLRSVADLLDVAKRHGLANRSLTAPSLLAIRRYAEQMAEELDPLVLSVDPEAEKLIGEGRADFAEGRGIPLDSLLQR